MCLEHRITSSEPVLDTRCPKRLAELCGSDAGGRCHVHHLEGMVSRQQIDQQLIKVVKPMRLGCAVRIVSELQPTEKHSLCGPVRAHRIDV
jgi:hypothetical protein